MCKKVLFSTLSIQKYKGNHLILIQVLAFFNDFPYKRSLTLQSHEWTALLSIAIGNKFEKTICFFHRDEKKERKIAYFLVLFIKTTRTLTFYTR